MESKITHKYPILYKLLFSLFSNSLLKIIFFFSYHVIGMNLYLLPIVFTIDIPCTFSTLQFIRVVIRMNDYNILCMHSIFLVWVYVPHFGQTKYHMTMIFMCAIAMISFL